MMAIRVRYARKSDVDALLGLWWKLHQFHVKNLKAKRDFRYLPDVLERMNKHYSGTVIPSRHVILAEDNCKPVAFCEFAPSSRPPIYKHRGVLKIWGLYVSPEYRGKGVGRMLIRRLDAIREQSGFSEMEVGAHVNNEAAISFYSSLGFRKRIVELVR